MAQASQTSPVAGAEVTRDRLLEAAGIEFAANGYEGTSIRAICRRAGASNLAAVRYYFGGKAQLYVQAVLEAHRCGGADLSEQEWNSGTPQERLRRFVSHFFTRVLAIGRKSSWHDDLMLREMIRPTQACRTLVESVIKPRFRRLRAIFQELAPWADARRLNALCFSVIGQCLFYRTTRPVTVRLVGRQALGALDHDFLTDHVTRIALAAIGHAPPLSAATSDGEAGS
jgi:AcrR family transcriptional regulator